MLFWVEVNTQSAGFSILTFTLHHAYPRAEDGWERQVCAQDTHRRTHNTRKYAATLVTFFKYTASGSQPNRRAARRRQSRRRRPGGTPEPPGGSRRAAAPPQLRASPLHVASQRSTAPAAAARGARADELGEDRAADRRGDARDLGADDGDGAGRPRGSAQQQVERQAV